MSGGQGAGTDPEQLAIVNGIASGDLLVRKVNKAIVDGLRVTGPGIEEAASAGSGAKPTSAGTK